MHLPIAQDSLVNCIV